MPSPGEDIQSWSVTAATNGNTDPLINWVEHQTRASVNNSARGLMAAHAKNRNLLNGSIVTTGSPNVQAFLSGVNYTTVPTGLIVKLKIGAGLTNTSATTLNMDGIGAVLIKDALGNDILGGELSAGGYCDLLFNGTNWIFLYSHEFFIERLTSGGPIVIGQQKFSTAGSFVYTPTAGTECAIVEAIAGGGAGGGAVAGANQVFGGGGGGSGGYSRKLLTIDQIGTSQPVTVGSGGVGVSNAAGGAGTDTSMGSLCLAKGGAGGGAGSASTVSLGGLGGDGGLGIGDITASGAAGAGGAYGNVLGGAGPGGVGGAGSWGGSGLGAGTITTGPGGNASNYGSGGGGGLAVGASVATGGNGSSGIVFVTEFAARGGPGRDGPPGPIGPAGPAGPGTGDVLVSGTPVAGQYARWINASTIEGVAAASSVSPPQGRLTLQTATPVMTTTQAAKTTIFYTPYVGDQIPITVDGATFTMTTFAELSQTTTDTTKSPAAVAANSVYDLFVWLDAGTIRCTRGPAWTNDTTRAAALVRVNGILLNNVAVTNGPTVQRGTYVGTVRSNASSQLDWIYGGTAAAGSPAWFGVWNAYNRVAVTALVGDNTASWTYGTIAWRAANNSNGVRVSYIMGLEEDAISVSYSVAAQPVGSNVSGVGIGRNSTIAVPVGVPALTQGGFIQQTVAVWKDTDFGFNFVNAIEIAYGSTSTFYGLFLTSPASVNQSGMTFEARM